MGFLTSDCQTFQSVQGQTEKETKTGTPSVKSTGLLTSDRPTLKYIQGQTVTPIQIHSAFYLRPLDFVQGHLGCTNL